MWALFVLAGFTSILIASSGYIEYMRHEVPSNSMETSREIAKFNAFAYAASVYFRDVTPVPPPNVAINWGTIKNTKGLPDTIKDADISVDWKIVSDTSGNYVLCTALAQGSIAAINNLKPPWLSSNAVSVMEGGNPKQMVVFAASAPEAVIGAEQCTK